MSVAAAMGVAAGGSVRCCGDFCWRYRGRVRGCFVESSVGLAALPSDVDEITFGLAVVPWG